MSPRSVVAKARRELPSHQALYNPPYVSHVPLAVVHPDHRRACLHRAGIPTVHSQFSSKQVDVNSEVMNYIPPSGPRLGNVPGQVPPLSALAADDPAKRPASSRDSARPSLAPPVQWGGSQSARMEGSGRRETYSPTSSVSSSARGAGPADAFALEPLPPRGTRGDTAGTSPRTAGAGSRRGVQPPLCIHSAQDNSAPSVRPHRMASTTEGGLGMFAGAFDGTMAHAVDELFTSAASTLCDSSPCQRACMPPRPSQHVGCVPPACVLACPDCGSRVTSALMPPAHGHSVLSAARACGADRARISHALGMSMCVQHVAWSMRSLPSLATCSRRSRLLLACRRRGADAVDADGVNGGPSSLVSATPDSRRYLAVEGSWAASQPASRSTSAVGVPRESAPELRKGLHLLPVPTRLCIARA